MIERHAQPHHHAALDADSWRPTIEGPSTPLPCKHRAAVTMRALTRAELRENPPIIEYGPLLVFTGHDQANPQPAVRAQSNEFKPAVERKSRFAFRE